MSDSPKNETVTLQLGDIIEIISPSDDNLNEKQFLIQYIDQTKIKLLGQDGNVMLININEEGGLENESITSIAILSRSDEKGYAKQNSLVPGQWIDIYFGGDLPATFTGKITGLEEDQIEIEVIDSKETIYIDFAYKGIPNDIPIEKFVLRDPPELAAELQISDKEKQITPGEEKQAEEVFDQDDARQGEMQLETPQEIPEAEAAFKERVKEIILGADQIEFGNKLDSIKIMVEVDDTEKRYGIDKQTTDMMNELLSDVPNSQRTENVLNNIHRMITRFKQLRKQFSKFDKYGNPEMPDIQGANFKPLVKSLEKLNNNLFWILPVVRNKKKIYDANESEVTSFDDIDASTTEEDLVKISSDINEFKTGSLPGNGYNSLISSQNTSFTPFMAPDNSDKDLSYFRVDANITAIVDNLEDFYSTVFCNESLKRKRFLIQEYSLGQNTLEATRIKGGELVVKVKQITKPDEINVKSFITLPEYAVQYSRVKLPATDIMQKCNLAMHYMPYWKILNKNTIVKTKEVLKTKAIMHDKNNYLSEVTHYSHRPNNELTYDKYLDNIIPKTRVLFDMIKKHINGRLSLHEIVSFLEPFMIYQRDLSFMQYREMVEFVIEKINNFKKDYAISKKDYDVLIAGFKNYEMGPELLNLLKVSKEATDEIKDGYHLDKVPIDIYNNSELLTLINEADCGRYMSTIIALINSDLMIKNGMDQLTNTDEWLEKYNQENESEKQAVCNTMILSKKYLALDELTDDNGKAIFFDKQYDTTYYDIIQEHISAIDNIPDMANKIKYLKEKLQESTGMSNNASEREAEAMLLKKKPVKDGDYAVLVLEEEDPPKMLYYKRRDTTWVRDEAVEGGNFTDNNKIFCDLQTGCMMDDSNTCQTTPKAAMDIQKITMDKIMKEFDESLKQNADAVKEIIKLAAISCNERLPALINIANKSFLKYDILKYNIGSDAKEVISEESPYSELIGIIMSQGDFVKRQKDIAKFVSYFTRPANAEEDEWWLYCISTNTKLLPTFIAKLSAAFINGDNYMLELQKIVATQGSESGDGEAICDKYSGWIITRIDFSTDEGFNAEGFMIRSKEVMEADLGNAIAQMPNQELKQYESEEADKIFRVANALCKYMGIAFSSMQDFVITETSKMLSARMPAKSDYEKAIAAALARGKKKKIDSYEKVYDETLILLTIMHLLFAIQTSIPAIKTRKTYPGCIRSFNGYPAFGDADKTGLTYLICVANGIKSSVEPWNAIKKLSAKKITSKIQGYANKFLIGKDIFNKRVADKIAYEESYIPDDIPDYLSIQNWVNFLPPLKQIKIGTVQPITKAFKEQFIDNLKRGSKSQHEKIDAIRSKMIYLSLAIQEEIQNVVTKNISKNNTILSNAANEPFLENACCSENNDSTSKYFESKAPEIIRYNDMVKNLRNILDDVDNITRASILFDPEDTRIIYPEIPSGFDEETIYLAFMTYCKYNSNLPISEELRAICMDKPDGFNANLSLSEKISKLKRDGRNFDNTSLMQLLEIINKNHMVKLNLQEVIYSDTQKMKDLLFSMNERNSEIVPEIFINKMIDAINNFSDKEKEGDVMRDVKNYLAATNQQMEAVISDFIRRNINDNRKHRTFMECINNLETFMESKNNKINDIFSMSGFIKNKIVDITKVFPSIIINKVSYSNPTIPSHWNISGFVVRDIMTFINEHYKPLSTFFGDEPLAEALKMYMRDINDINYLSSLAVYARDELFDERTIKLLFKFLLESCFIYMIELINRDELYEQSVDRPSNPLLAADIKEVDVAVLGPQAIPILEIISGEKKKMSEKIAEVMNAFVTIMCRDKKSINFNYETLKERVTRSKEKEKNIIVEYLGELSVEEREIENLFKNHRIGNWAVGQQKGFRIYQDETYEEERKIMEKRIEMEMNLGKIDGVTEDLMDVFMIEREFANVTKDQIEMEEYDISHIGEDNDGYGEAYDDM